MGGCDDIFVKLWMSKVDPNLGPNSGWLFGFPIQDVDWVDRSQTDPLATHDTIPDICHFFTRAKFLENNIYTEKTRTLRQNTQ